MGLDCVYLGNFVQTPRNIIFISPKSSIFRYFSQFIFTFFDHPISPWATSHSLRTHYDWSLTNETEENICVFALLGLLRKISRITINSETNQFNLKKYNNFIKFFVHTTILCFIKYVSRADTNLPKLL